MLALNTVTSWFYMSSLLSTPPNTTLLRFKGLNIHAHGFCYFMKRDHFYQFTELYYFCNTVFSGFSDIALGPIPWGFSNLCTWRIALDFQGVDYLFMSSKYRMWTCKIPFIIFWIHFYRSRNLTYGSVHQSLDQSTCLLEPLTSPGFGPHRSQNKKTDLTTSGSSVKESY